MSSLLDRMAKQLVLQWIWTLFYAIGSAVYQWCVFKSRRGRTENMQANTGLH
jgi:hypothetical protein